jgi:hypothetical protein
MIESGERPTDCCARYNFAIVSQDLGLRAPQRFCKHGRGPRIHDLRHNSEPRIIPSGDVETWKSWLFLCLRVGIIRGS